MNPGCYLLNIAMNADRDFYTSSGWTGARLFLFLLTEVERLRLLPLLERLRFLLPDRLRRLFPERFLDLDLRLGAPFDRLRLRDLLRLAASFTLYFPLSSFKRAPVSTASFRNRLILVESSISALSWYFDNKYFLMSTNDDPSFSPRWRIAPLTAVPMLAGNFIFLDITCFKLNYLVQYMTA